MDKNQLAYNYCVVCARVRSAIVIVYASRISMFICSVKSSVITGDYLSSDELSIFVASKPSPGSYF